MKEIKLTILLKNPLGTSLLELNELCKIWQILILKASTNNHKAIILMKTNSFEKMFNRKPLVGEVHIPPILESFISRITVTEVK